MGVVREGEGQRRGMRERGSEGRGLRRRAGWTGFNIRVCQAHIYGTVIRETRQMQGGDDQGIDQGHN